MVDAIFLWNSRMSIQVYRRLATEIKGCWRAFKVFNRFYKKKG